MWMYFDTNLCKHKLYDTRHGLEMLFLPLFVAFALDTDIVWCRRSTLAVWLSHCISDFHIWMADTEYNAQQRHSGHSRYALSSAHCNIINWNSFIWNKLVFGIGFSEYGFYPQYTQLSVQCTDVYGHIFYNNIRPWVVLVSAPGIVNDTNT